MTPPPCPSAEAITSASQSNLALAFFSLPKDRKKDITIFYAFCRVVDDIADSGALPVDERRAQLAIWHEALAGAVPGESPLAGQVREVIAKYRIPTLYFHEIIAGVEMDLVPNRFEAFADLRLYCYRVASAVGLVSIEIFGYQNPLCRQYAESLGLALQLTNILRDIGEDYANGQRIYLPLEEMARFGYSEADLAAKRYNAEFLALANFQADRALDFYKRAELPREDRQSMIAAEIMRGVYSAILRKMKRDGYRVLEKRYRLSGWEKALVIARTFAAIRLGG